MKIGEFCQAVEEARARSKEVLIGKVVSKIRPFQGDRDFECPWLRWRINDFAKRGIEDFNPKGILLMQDWGSMEQGLQEAVEELEVAVRHGSEDTTLRNLFNSEWHNAITSGEWIASNAIWGLRADVDKGPASKCGYLGAELHKAAFSVWSNLVAKIAEVAASPKFTLVVAGDWATFDDFPGEHGHESLETYLRRWISWAEKGPFGRSIPGLENRVQDLRGLAVHVSHPATWKNQSGGDWRLGPQV
jgi:hypothetical protein